MSAVAEQLTESMENYLETILLLIQKGPVARAKDIAEQMKVNRSSVTGALQALSARGLINYEPYGFVTLTPEGADIAGKVLRRHEALQKFFVSILGVDGDEASEAACRMEHGVSKSIVDRLLRFASFVDRCPRMGAAWLRECGCGCSGNGSACSCEQCAACISGCLERVGSPAVEKGGGS